MSMSTITDTANEHPWFQRVLTYDANLFLQTEQITYDDGRIQTVTYSAGIATHRAWTDPLDQWVWLTQSRQFDATTGLLTTHTSTLDDGTIITTNFVNGSISVRSTQDAGNQRIWLEKLVTYDAQGRLATGLTTFDDGRTSAVSYADGIIASRTDTDVSDAFSWATKVYSYDANGRMIDITTTRDNGTVVVTTPPTGPASATVTMSDSGNAYTWDEIRKTYDALGALVTKVVVLDDGLESTTQFSNGLRDQALQLDLGNTRGWTSQHMVYDTMGELAQTTTVLDGGKQTVRTYTDGTLSTLTQSDLGNTHVWSTSTTTFDALGDKVQQVINYDDGRQQTVQFANGVRDTATITDTTDAYLWDRIEKTYDSNGALLFSQIIFDDGTQAFRDIRGQDIIGGASTGAVIEDSAATLTTSGTLTINSTFVGTQSFVAQTDTAGSNGLGSFSLTAAGVWTFSADNALAAIDALSQGATITDHFSAVTPDGIAQVVTVTITGANDAPDVSPLNATTDETQDAFEVALLAGASDVDTGDTLSVENLIEDGSTFGGFTLVGSTLTYDATTFAALDAGESQIINFTFDVVDTNGGRTANALTLTVEGRDPTLAALDDSYATDEDTPISGDVSGNDTPLGGTYTILSGPDGDITFNSDGTFDYDPSSFFASLGTGDAASDSFTYQIDTGTAQVQATVTIDVDGLNDAPARAAPSVSNVRLVTEDVTDTTGGNGQSLNPAISADGNSIVFDSVASNLITGDTNARGDVYLEDPSETNSRASVQNGTNAEITTNGASGGAINADGTVVVFQSRASDLVPTDGGGTPIPDNNKFDIYVRDLNTGETQLLVPFGVDGNRLNGTSQNAAVSADGRLVVFQSNATNLVADADDNGASDDIYLHDRITGETVMVSQTVGTSETFSSFNPAISADGATVAFLTANSFDAADTNGLVDVYAYQVETDVLTLVSQSSTGVVGNQEAVSSVGGQSVSTPSVSGDGRFVTWVSRANNLVANDVNNADDVFVHDLATGETTRVSVSTSGLGSDGASFDAQISDNGRFVAFQSQATILDEVTPDTNGDNDIFVHDRLTGETIRISITPDFASQPGGGQPDISADGSQIVFASGTVTGNFDSRVTSGNVNDIYVATVDTAGFALTADATQLLIDLSAEWIDQDGDNLDFSNITVTSDDPSGSRVISFTVVTDGSGNVTGINLDPAQYVSLGAYATELLTINYDVTDGTSVVSGMSGVAISGVNDAPVGTDVSIVVNQGATVLGNFTATDADGDPLTFENLSTGLQGTLSVNDDGSFSYSAGAGQIVDDVVTIRVSDDLGGTTTLTATFDVNVPPVFTPPDAVQLALTQEIDPTATNAIDTSAFFTDPEGGALNFSAVIEGQSSLPNGLSIDSVTGIISGTPTTNDLVRIAVTATDAGGISTTGRFWLGIVDGTLSGDATAQELIDDGFSRLVDGQEGNDSLIGGDQGDIFVHSLGDGLDIIEETGFRDTDHLVMIGYASTDVVFERLSANPFEQKGVDLLIRPASGPDFTQGVVVRDGLGVDSGSRRISEFHFDDGVTLTDAEVRALILAGETTSGADDIRGFGAADTLAGGAGDDVLRGGDGSDLYIFNAGDGHDTIRDSGFLDTDIVQIGYNIGDGAFAQIAGSDDLQIDFGGGDALTLIGTINSFNDDGIEVLRFLDGDLSMEDVRNILTDQQTSAGDDLVEAFDRQETLQGGAGNDTLIGNDGSDTYVYRAGDGVDVIADRGFLDNDTLVIHDFTVDYDLVTGTVLPGSQVTFTRISNGEVNFATDDLLISLDDGAGTTGQITVLNTLTGNTANQIENINFADIGITLTMAQIRSELIHQQQSSGDDVVFGFSTADTITGGLGNDTLTGRDGADVYVFSTGDGHDIVMDGGFHDNDRVVLTDRSLADFTITYTGDDQSIVLEAGSDRIEIKGALAGGLTNNIAFFDFTDQTVTEQQMRQHVIDQALTLGLDLIGAGGAENLPGSPGSDRYVSGGEGDDTYYYGAGDGKDVIFDGGSGDTDTLDLTAFSSTDFALAGPNAIRFDPAFSNNVQLFIDANNTLDLLNMSDFEHVQFSDLAFDNDADDLDGVTNFEAFIASLVAEAVTADPNEDVITKVDIVDPGGDNSFTSTALNEHFALDGSGNDQLFFDVSAIGDDSVSKAFATVAGYNVTIDFSGIIADTVVHQDVSFRLSEFDPDDVIIEIVHEDSALVGPALGIGRVEESITLVGALAQFSGVDTITIIDTSGSSTGIASTAELQQLIIDQQVTSGDDIITGYTGADILRGGAGQDTLIGGRGNDTYSYASGDEGAVIVEAASSLGGMDILMIQDYALSDASIARSPLDANDLVFDFGGGDILTIQDFYPGNFNLEQIWFEASTGTPDIYSVSELSTAYLAQRATSGDDVLIGGNGANETLDGGLGNDLLDGADGSDTYIVRQGLGNDVIRDTGTGDSDNILFDVASTAVTFVQDRLDPADVYIVMPDGTTIEVINLIGGAIEAFTFTDQTLDASQARARTYEDMATNGDDLIIGSALGETLRGGLGDDVLSGGNGNDVFDYTLGDGDDILLATGNINSFELIRISGVDLADLQITSVSGTRDASSGAPSFDEDMLITFANDPGSIRVQNGLATSSGAVLVELTNDGTTLTTADLINMAIAADIAAGTTILEGPTTGGAQFPSGAEFIFSDQGDDVFVFTAGGGTLTILDDAPHSGINRLEIVGYNSTDATIDRLAFGSEDFVVRLPGGDQIVVLGDVTGGAPINGVNEIYFDGDNITLNDAAITAILDM